MRGSTDLDYTWYGVLVTDCDALLVLEKCLRGELAHIPRRPHDSERARLIKSGSIFVYESNASGIKRWTDGINWSPSRILTNFLVYHELEKAPPPGEKKRAIKRKRSEAEFDESDPKAPQRAILEEEWTDDDRRLMGSPQDNYGWKVNGLVKKTYSFDFRGASHHIISYFNPEDVRSGELKRPIHCREFQETFIRPELIEQGTRSRNPVTEAQIEQQRWERPLYSNDSSVSLLRQYPPMHHQASFAAPPQPLDFASSRASIPPHHSHLAHRSSIHFPMEDSMFGAATAPAYHPLAQPPTHVRHSSISTALSDGYQHNALRQQLVQSSGPLNVSPEASFSQSTLHHVRGHSTVMQSPPDAKTATVYSDESLRDSAYSSVSHSRANYAVSSPPMAMPTIDTSYSHSISRPQLYQGPHSTTDIHPPASIHIDSQPPAKRGRIETSYPNFSTVHWERTPPTPSEPICIPPDQPQYSSQLPVEAYSFPPVSDGFTATQGVTYAHTQEHALYSDMGPAFTSTQGQAMFTPPAYSYSQLTAPS